MTEHEFEVVATLIGSRGPAREGAKLVLVDKWGPADAAREVGVLPQSISNTVRRIRAGDELIQVAYKPLKKRLT